jgi:phosphoglycolate phosphatase
VSTSTTLMLFDLDGCLVDSTAAITGCLNHALAALDLPPRPVDELRRFIGPPLLEAFETLLAEAGAPADRAPVGIAAYRARYATASLTDTRVVAGIPEVLDALRRRAALRIVTSKPRAFALPIVEHLGLADWFDEVHGPDVGLVTEPKARTLARALAAAGRPAAAAVMVGDRRHDVEAGRANGTRTVGVTWGAGEPGELEAAGADHVVDRPAELLALVGRDAV